MRSSIVRIGYSWTIFLFGILIRITGVWNAKARVWRNGRKGQWARIKNHEKSLIGHKRIWMHCASSGEFQQGRPLIEKLKKASPDNIFLVSFFSPSGYHEWKDDPLIDMAFYLPLDTSKNAHRLVNILAPSMVLFVKNEFWFHLISTLRLNNIPVFFVSAVFHSKHHIFLPFFKETMQGVNHLFVQDPVSYDVLHSKGFNNVSVAGDTRIDYIMDYKDENQVPKLLEDQKNKFSECIVYGSVWASDLKILSPFIMRKGDILHIIVPHETDPRQLESCLSYLPDTYSLLSSVQSQMSNVVVVDMMGLLKSLYSMADMAYVGGGFGKGIHNILEPAIHNIPVIFGPRHKKITEANELIRLDVAMAVNNPGSFEKAYLLLSGSKGPIEGKMYTYFNSRKGATERIIIKLKDMCYA